jgi:uncharacterized protein
MPAFLRAPVGHLAARRLAHAVLRFDRTPVYPVRVHAVDGDRVVLSRDTDTVVPIPFGLVWPGGSAVLTGAVVDDGDRVVRTLAGGAAPVPGVAAYIDTQVYTGDPGTAHGLGFADVTVEGELGGLPAWSVPPVGGDPAAGTWVVAVHGLGATRAEALRALPVFARAGVQTLVVSYRNDPGAPASPDGYCHLGDTEWRDLAAAVRYAADHGARAVLLHGWSMGGLLALTALRRMPPAQRDLVRGVVLDSPVLDWTATLADQAARRGVRPPRAARACRLIAERAGVSLAELSIVDVDRPALLFLDLADHTVPPEPALRWARARPDLVRLVTTARGHCRSWNADPARYGAELRAFVAAHR